MKTAKSRLAAAVAVVALATTSRAADVKLAEWLESVKVGGDMRLRFEDFQKFGAGQPDRTRQRFRLRLGMESALPHGFAVGLRFASGTGEQVSTNQSFDNLSAQKAISIDRAFLAWAPCRGAKLTGGRMANPFWTAYTSDVVWDEDFNPEGYAENLRHKLGEVSLFLNALQMVADEESGTSPDQWMFGEQLGAELPLPMTSTLTVAVSHYKWTGETTGTFSQAVTNEGNRRTGATLSNEFGVGEVTAEVATRAGPWPLSIQGTYVKNFDSVLSPKDATGYQVGARLGKASSMGSWEAAYYYKRVETDATVADVADADFGDGGTNRKGHIVWLGYSPTSWMNLKAKYFITEVVNPALPPTSDSINRLQVDAAVRF